MTFWRDDIIGCETLKKVKLMYLQVKLKENQFNLSLICFFFLVKNQKAQNTTVTIEVLINLEIKLQHASCQ